VQAALKPIDPPLTGTKLKEKEEANRKLLVKLNVHTGDYAWLVWADRLLIVTGVLLMITLALWVREEECRINQMLVIALLMATVLYLAALHIRQWIIHA
jgi:hypothetical protein